MKNICSLGSLQFSALLTFLFYPQKKKLLHRKNLRSMMQEANRSFLAIANKKEDARLLGKKKIDTQASESYPDLF